MLVAEREIDGTGRRMADGLLAELARETGRISDGQLLALRIDPGVADDVLNWSRLTGHPVVERVDEAGTVRMVVRKGRAAAMDDDVDLGARLWIYTNLHCNLQCDYCCVRSSPTVAPRIIPADEIERLVAEARKEGFRSVFLTGGEPFMRQDIGDAVTRAARHLPVTLLTNAMLFQGHRLETLQSFPRDRVTLQVSLDSPTPELHDSHRGTGSWQKAWDGIRTARSLGFRVRVAATCAKQEERDAMDVFLEEHGFPPEDRVIRPLARRGEATERTQAVAVTRTDLVPELTVTAEGVFWHPVGATDQDLKVADVGQPLSDVVDNVRKFLQHEAETGERLMSVFHCA